MDRFIVMAAALLLAGCQAAVAVATIQNDTFGEPTMVEEFEGREAPFAECVRSGLPGVRDATPEGAYKVTITKPDVGSYEFYIEIEQRGTMVRVSTWVAGWASSDVLPALQRRYRECAG